MSDRNPFIIPETPKDTRRRGCPVCGGMKYDGRMQYGVVTWKCADCKNEWHGGIGVEPADPTVPAPPQNPKDRPNIEWQRTREGGDTPQAVTVKRPDLTQDFRKGALIPPGEE
jgi:hypothetical protein